MPHHFYQARQISREPRGLHQASRSSGEVGERPLQTDQAHGALINPPEALKDLEKDLITLTTPRGLNQACRSSGGLRNRTRYSDQAHQSPGDHRGSDWLRLFP